MAAIKGLPKNLTMEELQAEVAKGARFVVFHACVSIIILTHKSQSEVFYIRPGRSRHLHYANVFCTIATLLLGWWSIPWGPISTVQALNTNFSGGEDVTLQVMDRLYSRMSGEVDTPPQER